MNNITNDTIKAVLAVDVMSFSPIVKIDINGSVFGINGVQIINDTE